MNNACLNLKTCPFCGKMPKAQQDGPNVTVSCCAAIYPMSQHRWDTRTGNMEINILSEKEVLQICREVLQPQGYLALKVAQAICARFPTAKPVNEGHQYQCICCHCGELFVGDKRGVSCPKCSKPPVKEELERERLDRFLITIGLSGMSRPEASCDVLRKRLVEKLSEQFAVTNKPEGK